MGLNVTDVRGEGSFWALRGIRFRNDFYTTLHQIGAASQDFAIINEFARTSEQKTRIAIVHYFCSAFAIAASANGPIMA